MNNLSNISKCLNPYEISTSTSIIWASKPEIPAENTLEGIFYLHLRQKRASG